VLPADTESSHFTDPTVKMKVVEKNCDRRAEAHIYIEEKVDALEEYGEYIETRDKAICCYVPVEEGHKVKIGGKSTGTVSHSVVATF